MKQVFILLCFTVFFIVPLAAQTNGTPKSDSSVSIEQKHYFPAAGFSDEANTSAAIIKLAGQLITVYTEKNKGTYFSTMTDLHALSNNYSKALVMLDSADKITSDKSKTIYPRSYASAKIKTVNNPAAFDKAFQKEFETIFTGLSFNKKVYTAFIDSSTIGSVKEDYSKLIEKIKKNKTDSISTEDAIELCKSYFDYIVFNSTFTLAQPYVGDPKYKKYYPVIKGADWSAVYPVNNVEELPDPKMKYKLLIELVDFAPKDPDSTIKKNVNLGLVEVGRLINLHVANGIPKENLDIVIVVHASALRAFLNNDEYKKKYGVDNPNIPFLKEMESVGVKLLACGQAILFLGLEKEQMLPSVKVVLTAQTVLTSYQLKGYVLKKITLNE
jgi:intracellular sulfur oxidation DsrE/DsrF family protein